jgi:PAS domain S-box-containing protein
MNKRTDIEQLEEKIFHWRTSESDYKKEHMRFSPEEAVLLIEDLTLKNIQGVQIEQLNAEISKVKDEYQELYDSYPGGYLTLDENCGIKEANLAIAQILGIERQNLLKSNLSQFIPSDSESDFRTYYVNLLQNRTLQTCKLQMKENSGTLFNAMLSGIAIVDSKKSTAQCRLFLTPIASLPDSNTVPEQTKAKVDDELKNYFRLQLYQKMSQKCTT